MSGSRRVEEVVNNEDIFKILKEFSESIIELKKRVANLEGKTITKEDDSSVDILYQSVKGTPIRRSLSSDPVIKPSR